MKLSQPIFALKSKAKKLKISHSISLTEAQNLVAKEEGFSSWSLLISKAKNYFPKTKKEVLDFLFPGDLMLIASRPGLRKTTFTLEILVQASKEKRKCFFFSLEYTLKEVAKKVSMIDESIGQNNPFLTFDFSDQISSEYIIQTINEKVETGSVIAIDYLQILDQDRSKPSLQKQIEDLKQFAKKNKCIFLFVSQVDRSFEEKNGTRPSLNDIRLPNPVNLKLFNKNLFLHDDKMYFNSPRNYEVD